MAKRILEYENVNIEIICIEITISKRKWCLTFACRLPYNNNKAKMSDSHSHMSDLSDTFSLSNLVNGVTRVKSQNGTSIDVMLTNRPKVFTIPV